MVQNLPTSERPRERCLNQGASCLSLRECLALILGTGPKKFGSMGVASNILAQPGGEFGAAAIEEERAFFTALETTQGDHLKHIRGLGKAGQARILATFELARRYSAFREKSRRASPRRSDASELAVRAIKNIPESRRHDPEEWLAFVPVHRSGVVGEFCLVEKGVRTHVNTDPIELFSRILALRPQGYFLFHNHPNGTLLASRQDVELTAQVSRISSLLQIRMLGHWIVTSTGEKLVPLH